MIPPFLPLNVDAYTLLTIQSPNTFLANSFGVLDGVGQGSSSITAAPGTLNPTQVGLVLHHAFLVIDGAATIVKASGAVPLTLVP